MHHRKRTWQNTVEINKANIYLFSFKFFWCLFTHPSLARVYSNYKGRCANCQDTSGIKRVNINIQNFAEGETWPSYNSAGDLVQVYQVS